MRVLALLPSTSMERLRVAVDLPTRLTATMSVSDAMHYLVRESDWDLFVVDPDMVPQQHINQFLGELPRYSPPILVYTSLARASAAAIAVMAGKFYPVVLRDYDDGVLAFSRTLTEGIRGTLGPLMVGRIARQLDLLPGSLKRGTVAAFCAREPVTSVKQFSGISSLSRRSVDRWLRNVDLGGGKLVLSVSHLLRAYCIAEFENGSLNSVAVASGYGSAKALQNNSVRLTGMTFPAMRASVNPTRLLAKLENVLRGVTRQ